MASHGVMNFADRLAAMRAGSGIGAVAGTGVGAITQIMRSQSMFNARGERVSPRRFVEGGRHGSAEHGLATSARRPRSRDRMRYAGEETQTVRTGPAGQEERRSWLDALNEMSEKINRIELDTRSNAQAIADIKTKVQAEHNYTRSLRNDLNAQMFTNPDSITRKIGDLDARIRAIPETLETRDALLKAKLDAIESTLNSLVAEVSNINSGGPRQVFQSLTTPAPVPNGAEQQAVPMSPIPAAEVPIGYGALGAPAPAVGIVNPVTQSLAAAQSMASGAGATQEYRGQVDEMQTRDPWVSNQAQPQSGFPTAQTFMPGISGPKHFTLNADEDRSSPFQQGPKPSQGQEVPRIPASFEPCTYNSPVPTRQKSSPFEEPGHGQGADPTGFEQFQRFVHARGMDPRIVSEFQSWAQGGMPAHGSPSTMSPTQANRISNRIR